MVSYASGLNLKERKNRNLNWIHWLTEFSWVNLNLVNSKQSGSFWNLRLKLWKLFKVKQIFSSLSKSLSLSNSDKAFIIGLHQLVSWTNLVHQSVESVSQREPVQLATARTQSRKHSSQRLFREKLLFERIKKKDCCDPFYFLFSFIPSRFCLFSLSFCFSIVLTTIVLTTNVVALFQQIDRFEFLSWNERVLSYTRIEWFGATQRVSIPTSEPAIIWIRIIRITVDLLGIQSLGFTFSYSRCPWPNHLTKI